MIRLPTAILCLAAMTVSGCMMMPPMREPEPTPIRVIRPAPAPAAKPAVQKTTVKKKPVRKNLTRRLPSMPVTETPPSPIIIPRQGGEGGGGGNDGPSGGGWG